MAEIEFYDRILDETLALLTESQRYLGAKPDGAETALSIQQRLTGSVETMRLVARLTQVLAWVLTQRAIIVGEISTRDSLHPDRRLGGQELCLHDSSAEMAGAPDQLQNLLSKSLDLYRRVARLDAMADRNARQAMNINHDVGTIGSRSAKPEGI